MEACAVICRKAIVISLDANFPSSWCQSLSSRAQNRGFCALLAFGTPVFSAFEHKIEVFVLFWPSGPPFSGVSSTKSGFLCAFGLRDPHFRAFRAQNQGFCALSAFGTAIFWLFDHKNEDFVRFCQLDKLNEQDEPNELNERDKQDKKNGQGELSSQKKRVAKVVTLSSFASLL